jgi:hypothetical protein
MSVDATILPLSVLAKRKPMLLFRLVGVFLLRFAERRFCGLLFQEPPRRTREEGAGQGWCWPGASPADNGRCIRTVSTITAISEPIPKIARLGCAENPKGASPLWKPHPASGAP